MISEKQVRVASPTPYLHVMAARRAATSRNLPAGSSLGSLLAQVRVLPKDRSGGPWGVVTVYLTLYTRIYLFKVFFHVLDPYDPPKPHQT